MKHLKQGDFDERRKAAAEAKKKLLEKLKNGPKADDPEVIARRAERVAIAEAREARRVEREAAKQAEAERLRLEEAARIEQEAARAAAEAEAARIREEEEAAARKAERDRRYAARKNRKH